MAKLRLQICVKANNDLCCSEWTHTRDLEIKENIQGRLKTVNCPCTGHTTNCHLHIISVCCVNNIRADGEKIVKSVIETNLKIANIKL